MVGITNSVNLNSSGGGRLSTEQLTCICTKAANATTITMNIQLDGTSVFSDTITCDIYGTFTEKTGNFLVEDNSVLVKYHGTKIVGSSSPFLFVSFEYDNSKCEILPNSFDYAANGDNSSYPITNTTRTSKIVFVGS